MLVKLKKMWFGPDMKRYLPDPAGTLVPDKYKALLPSTAKIIGPEDKPLPVPDPHKEATLKEADPLREDARREQAKLDQAEQVRKENAERLQRQLSKEKGK